MASNESTAINALLHNLYTRPIEEPAPSDDLFVTARPAPAPARPAPTPFVKAARTDPATLPVAIAEVPSINPVRVARGTNAPPVRESAEQTELWDAPPQAPARPITAQPGKLTAASARKRAIAFVEEPIVQRRVPSARQVAIAELPTIGRPALMPVAPVPPPSASRTGYHIFKELMLSSVGLGLVAILALGIGVYLAVKTRGETDAPKVPTERDRAVAIMTGAPVPEVPQHVVAPEPTVTPIPAVEVTTPAPVETPVVAAVEPAVEPASETSDDAVHESDIEIEANTPTTPAKKRTKKAKRMIAAASEGNSPKPTPIKETKVDNSDPVLAAIHAKPKAEKPIKTGPAVEVATARGAAPTKGSGQVTIASNVKALIFVDGRPTGKSSPSALVMAAGDHQITLLDPDTKKAKTASIQVAANKSVTVRKEF